MANMRRQPVSYRPFKATPLLAEGLLPVARGGGELEAKVADAFFRIGGMLGDYNDRVAERRGREAGERDALAGRPGDITVPGGTPGAADAHGLLRKEEGFRPEAYWDVNHWRVGFGSDTYTAPDGSVHEVTKATRVDRAAAERDLDRRIGAISSTIAGQIGEANWGRLPAATKAALASVSYNYGHLPGRVRDAAKGGDLGVIADAVEALSANKGRRAREAALIRGSAATPPGTAGVDPSVQAPKIVEVANAGGGFRPTGSDTIYGRAYDAAGTKTYLSELRNEVETTTAQVYERWKDDPATLAARFADLKKLQLRDDVFPEIRAEYETSFDRIATGYTIQAGRNAARKAEQQNRADFLDRQGDLETTVARKVEGFDADNPAAIDEIWGAQRAVEDGYDDAVRHGIMDPEAAERAKETSRRRTAVTFYGRQAENLDAAGVKELHEKMREDFSAGKLDHVDAAGWKVLDAQLDRIERNKEVDDRQASAALKKRGDSFVARASAGFDIDQAEMGRFLLDAKTAPDGKEIVHQALKEVEVAQVLRDLPIGKAAETVRDMRAKLGAGASASEVATAQAAEKMLAATRKDLATNLLGHAERMRVIGPTGSFADASTPQDFASIMQGRIDAADKAAAHFGVPPQYFKPGEVKAIEGIVTADPEAGAAIAGALVSGSGSRASDVVKAFGKDAPVIAGAGAIIAGGGSFQAAADAIAGAGKDQAGKPYKKLPAETRSATAGSTIGGALALQPDDAARIAQTGELIAAKRLADNGIDPKGDEAAGVYARAIDEAAGAIFDGNVQYGGFATLGSGWFAGGYRVLVPNGIAVDRFGDVLAAIRDGDLDRVRTRPVDLDGKILPASLLHQFRPVAVAGGYAFSRNDPTSPNPQFVYGEDGKPFVLDVEALAPKLAPRVPGAFRGY